MNFKNIKNIALMAMVQASMVACGTDTLPIPSGSLAEMVYSPDETKFSLWAPTAEAVNVVLYDKGIDGEALDTLPMQKAEEGTWNLTVKKNLIGKFYTFNVKVDGRWRGETPGINALAVGVNGRRGAIIDMAKTNPEGWENDVRPPLNNPADVIIYEVHHRDFSIHPSSGIQNKGKYLAMTEEGSFSPQGLATGIDHLKELGVTHVHILPSYDYDSVDETRLEANRYNWG